MLKYVDTKIVFQEIPDEVTLAINISRCPCNCKNCHSSYLAQDIGENLTINVIRDLIKNNEGITCISFMGGDVEPYNVNVLASYIKNFYGHIKVAWYSGRQEISEYIGIGNFDYIKVGPYIEKLGPLSSTTTNQIMYKIEQIGDEVIINDITYKFWK
jgi:anaerobic ribonucleoside-triphosphate reductase activating protein